MVHLDQRLRILYNNWDTVTATIVVSEEVDKQECHEFFGHFKNFVET